MRTVFRIKFISVISIATILSVTITSLLIFQGGKAASKSDQVFGKPEWAFTPEERIITSLVDNEFHIFIQTLDSIYSLNTKTGNILWRVNALADPVIRTPMYLSDDILLVQGNDATVMAYAADTGKLLWVNQNTKTGWIEDMDVNGNNLYVARYSTTLTSFDLDDGRIRWWRRVPSRDSLYIFSDNNVVLLGTSHSLLVYDKMVPGDILKERNLDHRVGNMQKVGDTLFIAYYQNEGISISAIDINTFESMWSTSERKLPGLSSIETMIPEDNTLYAFGNRVAAVSSLTGEVLWINNEEISYKYSSISENIIYVADDSFFYLFDKISGNEINRVSLPGLPSLQTFIHGMHINMAFYENYSIIVSYDRVYCYPRSKVLSSK